MTLQTGVYFLAETFEAVRAEATAAKAAMQAYIAALAAGPVDAPSFFQFLVRSKQFMDNMDRWGVVSGLDAYATSQGYPGTLTGDMTSCVTAAQAVMDWIVANFPKDSTQTYILAYSLSADGSLVPRTFTAAQTAQLRVIMQSFVDTIS